MKFASDPSEQTHHMKTQFEITIWTYPTERPNLTRSYTANSVDEAIAILNATRRFVEGAKELPKEDESLPL